MSEQRRRRFTIHAKREAALWPGGEVCCVRLTAPRWMPDLYYLVDQEGRVSELRAYRYREWRRP